MAGYGNFHVFISNQLCWPLPLLTVQIQSAILTHPEEPSTLADSSILVLNPAQFLLFKAILYNISPPVDLFLSS